MLASCVLAGILAASLGLAQSIVVRRRGTMPLEGEGLRVEVVVPQPAVQVRRGAHEAIWQLRINGQPRQLIRYGFDLKTDVGAAMARIAARLGPLTFQDYPLAAIGPATASEVRGTDEAGQLRAILRVAVLRLRDKGEPGASEAVALALTGQNLGRADIQEFDTLCRQVRINGKSGQDNPMTKMKTAPPSRP